MQPKASRCRSTSATRTASAAPRSSAISVTKRRGIVLVGSYRQIVTYRGDKIERMEEFHDAAKMIAFWQMISGDAAIQKALLAESE